MNETVQIYYIIRTFSSRSSYYAALRHAVTSHFSGRECSSPRWMGYLCLSKDGFTTAVNGIYSVTSYCAVRTRELDVNSAFRISVMCLHMCSRCKHISRHMTDFQTFLLSLQQFFFWRQGWNLTCDTQILIRNANQSNSGHAKCWSGSWSRISNIKSPKTVLSVSASSQLFCLKSNLILSSCRLLRLPPQIRIHLLLPKVCSRNF